MANYYSPRVQDKFKTVVLALRCNSSFPAAYLTNSIRELVLITHNSQLYYHSIDNKYRHCLVAWKFMKSKRFQKLNFVEFLDHKRSISVRVYYWNQMRHIKSSAWAFFPSYLNFVWDLCTQYVPDVSWLFDLCRLFFHIFVKLFVKTMSFIL